jgi:transketolase
MNTEILTKASTIARGLAMDAVAAAKSGHLGLPLGATEIGAVLFGEALIYNPEDPQWLNRDRFVLSAGHGSMFLYAWLHLAGYAIPMDQIKKFRQLHSITPGHPEFGETPGVEATTGPLGQGVGNAVGMAVAAKMLEARFNSEGHPIFDHHIVCLAGDGCLQEGVSSEASAFAGRQGLDNLILFYDSNDVTLDADAAKTQSEDTAERYKAYGFDVVTIDGHNFEAVLQAFEKAKENDNGRPKLIICKTIIGKGIPEVQGTCKAHGEAGVKFVDAARKALGLPEERFYVSQEVYDYFKGHREKLKARYATWQQRFQAWSKEHPDKADLLAQAVKHEVPADLLQKIPEFPADKAMATRVAGAEALNAIAKEMPLVISGSADLHGSTKNYIKDGGDFDRDNRAGRNIHFGIREHAMGAIMNGFGYYGIFRASGATFLTFSDYMRPSVRLAALAKLPVFYIWTHDSVGVGEDGPTHEPVETVSSLRLIPNLDVIRPCDSEEAAGAFVAAMEDISGPTALVLSRQDLPNLSVASPEVRRKGVLKGGYVLLKETEQLKAIILATGSEVQLAVDAAKRLGGGVRVVSVPSFRRFQQQPVEYRESVLPITCHKRVAIEAGVSDLWYRYVGQEGKIIGIDRFGLSAPAEQIFKELGITSDAVVEAVQSLLK